MPRENLKDLLADSKKELEMDLQTFKKEIRGELKSFKDRTLEKI